jgi:hypothetical protein
MPTTSAALAAREAFDNGTKAMNATVATELKLAPAASTASAPQESQPAADTPASIDDANIDAEESPTTAAVSSGDTVDDSSASDSTTDDASDASEHADLTSETADTQPAKPRSRAQARIEDLVASNKALKTSLDYLQNQVLAKMPQQQTPQPVAQPAPVAEEQAPPTLESVGFDTDKWTQAMHAWTRKQIASGVQQAVTTVQQNQTEASRRAAFESRMTAFGAVTPDLQVVLGNPALPRLAKEAAELVVDSELGPQILHHLGKNPEKAARIARQSPVQQAASIGRLEAEIAATKPTTAQKKPISVTKAPSPPTPTKGNSGAPATDVTKMSMKDFIAQDRAQMAEKRRR